MRAAWWLAVVVRAGPNKQAPDCAAGWTRRGQCGRLLERFAERRDSWAARTDCAVRHHGAVLGGVAVHFLHDRQRQALGRPYVWDGGLDGQPGSDDADQDQVAAAERMGAVRRQPSAGGADALTCAAPGTERAVIGDHLRQLAVWCQVGRCIARYTDAAALGEADIRSRALASGWCLDAFGRLVCPSCQQLYPVWSARPLSQ